MADNNLKRNRQGYGYKYTDLSAIHEYLEEINSRYIQKIERIGEDDYVMTKRCFDNKWEEEWLQGCRVVQATLQGIKNPAQEQGSALTYARRYSLLLAYGLSTEDDDAASLTQETSKKQTKSTTKKEVTISTLEDAVSYEITFGEHKGKTLGEIVETNKNYANWLYENGDTTIKSALKIIIESMKGKE